MPRSQRVKSESGIYHIMIRGVNQQPIFQDVEDNQKFIEILKNCKSVSGFQLFAYCLMGNHVHILMKEEKESLETIFKRIGNRYVYWYNTKYRRIGHLFQDRFKSEPVETDEYFLTVVRYIHQNPVKAGLVKQCEDYSFSSYNEYLRNDTIIDKEFLLNMISPSDYRRYHRQEEQNSCLEIKYAKPRLTDEQAKVLIMQISGCKNVEQFQKLPINKQNSCIKQLKNNNLSIRQISRLTGVTIGIIRKK